MTVPLVLRKWMASIVKSGSPANGEVSERGSSNNNVASADSLLMCIYIL